MVEGHQLEKQEEETEGGGGGGGGGGGNSYFWHLQHFHEAKYYYTVANLPVLD